MKAISYKMKNWIGSFIIPKEALETCNYPEHVLRLQKERQTWQKSKINLLFLWKTRVEASKVITNSLKTLDFVTPIPFDTFPWIVLCDLSLTKLGNNKTEKKKARLCKTCFYRKKFISKDMKAISYKMKNWIGSFILPKEALETCNYPEHVLRLQKERQTWQKSQKLIYFFCEKHKKFKYFFKKKLVYERKDILQSK